MGGNTGQRSGYTRLDDACRPPKRRASSADMLRLPCDRDVSDITKAPEMLGGRVKTLHPAVHGGVYTLF